VQVDGERESLCVGGCCVFWFHEKGGAGGGRIGGQTGMDISVCVSGRSGGLL